MNFNNTHTNYLQRDPHSEDSPLMRSACKYVCMEHALRSCDSIALLCGYVTALLDLRARDSCTLALFSLELSRQAFFPRGFHGPALSLELALRQSWSLTVRPFGMSCGSLAAELPGTVRLSE